LQGFDLEIRDKKGVENIIVDHLYHIPNAPIEITPINENFPDEHILAMCKESWYADSVNYLATRQTPSDWIGQVRINIIFLLRYGSSFGKNRFFSNIVLIKSSKGVYLRRSIGVC